MAETAEAEKTNAPKMVRESDLLAVKKQVDRLRQEVAKKEAEAESLRSEASQLRSKLKVAEMTEVDDDDVKEVRAFLLERESSLNDREKKIRADELSYEQRQRESRVKALAAEYEVDEDTLMDSEDPEKTAMALRLERLTKGDGSNGKKTTEEVKTTTNPAERTFESASPGQFKKAVKDMTDKEFVEYEAQMKRDYATKGS